MVGITVGRDRGDASKGLPMQTSRLRRVSQPAAPTGLAHRIGNALAYLSAAIIGLSVGPALLMLADRTTALHWMNYVLDLVAGR
jgi:hypothetical protein